VPIDPLVHSRAWKAQVPYLAREFQVIRIDPRGNGRGRCLDYDQTGPEALAQAIAAEIGRPVSYRPVETDGAARAAALLSELI
jgi:pimeloyl-ACP methyl ester carboxylesterase